MKKKVEASEHIVEKKPSEEVNEEEEDKIKRPWRQHMKKAVAKSEGEFRVPCSSITFTYILLIPYVLAVDSLVPTASLRKRPPEAETLKVRRYMQQKKEEEKQRERRQEEEEKQRKEAIKSRLLALESERRDNYVSLY